MKKIILNLTCLFAGLIVTIFSLQAQSFSTGFEFGAGSSYIGENYESGSLTDFETSFTAGANIKYLPQDAYFGIKLNILYVSTLFTAQDIVSQFYYGEVSTITTSILLEHLKNTKKVNFGYNVGMGMTRENYNTHRNYAYNYSTDIRNYMSITISGIMAYTISDNSSVSLSPTLLWTDPINTMQPDNWYNAREDISVLIQLGYTYKLK